MKQWIIIRCVSKRVVFWILKTKKENALRFTAKIEDKFQKSMKTEKSKNQLHACLYCVHDNNGIQFQRFIRIVLISLLLSSFHVLSLSQQYTKNKLRNLEYAIVSTTQDVDTQLMRSQWNSTRIAKACKHRGFSFILCVRLPEISHNQRLARNSWAHIWCERHHFCCEHDSNLIVAYTFSIFSINSNSSYFDAVVSNKNVCFYFKYPMIIGRTGNFC